MTPSDELPVHDETIVQLMRGSVAELRYEPVHALRLQMRLAGGYAAALAQVRRHLSVGANDFDALLALWDGGHCTMSELGRRISMARAAVTSLTNRLEERGLAVRVADPEDRRAILVMVTPMFEQQMMEVASAFAPELQRLARRSEWDEYAVQAVDVRVILRQTAQAMSTSTPMFDNHGRRSGAEPVPQELDPVDQQWW